MDNILSIKNKEFLWNILYEKKIFQGIPNDKIENVKNIFESSINNVINNTQNDNIIEINKEILVKINSEINKLKNNLLNSKNVKDEFKDEKTLIFDKNLNAHKDSLNKLINPDKPKEIDFKDKEDKPINNDEMNRILEEMQKDRNINNIENKDRNINNIENKDRNINNIENKISGDNLIKTNNIMDTINEVPKLKIESIEELLEDDVIELNETQTINKPINNVKQESFKLKDINSLLEDEYVKENKINSNMKLDNIYKLLNKVLENQEKIMNKLELI